MKFLTIFSVLVVAICAYGAEEDMSDKDMFLRIIQCSQQAIIKGLPEIDLPSHDPLRISKNFTYDVTIGDYNLTFAMENMYIEGIPWWNVTQMDDITEKESNPVFNYTIYWKLMAFEGTWRLSVIDSATSDLVFEKTEGFGIELDHLTFSGLFNFSKPEDDNEEGFNELTLHLHTEESEVHIDGLDVVSDIISLVGGPALKDLINLDLVADAAGTGIRDKLNRDWIGKPERVEALISNCDTSALSKNKKFVGPFYRV